DQHSRISRARSLHQLKDIIRLIEEIYRTKISTGDKQERKPQKTLYHRGHRGTRSKAKSFSPQRAQRNPGRANSWRKICEKKQDFKPPRSTKKTRRSRAQLFALKVGLLHAVAFVLEKFDNAFLPDDVGRAHYDKRRLFAFQVLLHPGGHGDV